MTTPNNTTELSELFYALSLAKPVPDAQVLDELIRRSPEHADALTDFAIELVMDALEGESNTEDKIGAHVSPVVSRAISRFQNRLFALQSDQLQKSTDLVETVSTKNPFVDLSRSDFRSLTQRLKATAVFVTKLRDRLIDPKTMTEGFCQHVANELKVPKEVLVAHFTAKPVVQAYPQHFRADQKPEVGTRQSFKEAVQSSGLTEEQQQYLLGL